MDTVKRPIAIVTACMTQQGLPTFALNEVTVSQDEIANGIHYYLAEAQLMTDGFDEPYIHFDAMEAPPFLHAAVRQLLVQSPVVVINPPLPALSEAIECPV